MKALDDETRFDTRQADQGSPIMLYLQRLLSDLRNETSGAVADYIPELSRADPGSFGIALCTIDGKIYKIGDCEVPHTIQSMSKPFTYGLSIAHRGRERVLEQVGVEPTGEAFNSIILDDEKNRPFNPMVNAGAIAVSELLAEDDAAMAERRMRGLFSDLAGRPLAIDEDVYRSEKATGHRNRAIAYMMLNSGMISRDPEAVLDLYFRQCSVSVTCVDMAIMAASLANHGINPRTEARVFDPDVVRDVLTLMNTCGMYNYAGEWAYEVGIPAKSGVSGGIIAVIPGQLGIAVYSPPLDSHGNSIRGVQVCAALSRDFSLHAFSDRTNVHAVIRRQYCADTVPSKRMRPASERSFLREHGGTICVIEVQGALYFGSAEILTRRMASLQDACRYFILDFKRANYADPAARRLIAETAHAILASGSALAFTNIREDSPLSQLRGLPRSAPGLDALEVIEDTDRALEMFEERLLENWNGGTQPTRFSLGELDLFAGIPAEGLKLIEGLVQSFQFEAGQQILREGDEAQLFFIVVKGSASVLITLKDGTRRRIGSVGLGASFGEMALIDGARRSAAVIADERLICYGFPVAAVRDLAESHPWLYAQILSNLVKRLADHLRLANEEIRALE